MSSRNRPLAGSSQWEVWPWHKCQGWVSEWAVGDSVDCSPVGGGPPGTFT